MFTLRIGYDKESFRRGHLPRGHRSATEGYTLSSSWKYPLLGLAALLTAASSQRAQAQTVGLVNGNTLSYDGLTYTVSGCGYVKLRVAQSSCSVANAALEVVGSGTRASVEIVNGTAGTPLMSIASTAGNTYSDISVIVTVSNAPTSRLISSASISEVGIGNIADPNQVTSGVTIGTPTANYGLNPANLASLTSSVSFTPYSPSGANYTTNPVLSFNLDLKVSTMPGVGGNVGTVSLTSATIHAPEPASIAVFATALTGLTAVRRRFKRRVGHA